MKVQKTIFLLAFCVLLIAPVLKFDFQSKVATNENRELAVFPNFFSTSTVNWKFFSQLDSYIQDRFGFRTPLINLDAEIQYDLLKSKGNSRVLLGKDDWYFYIDKKDNSNYDDYLKRNLVDKQTVKKFVRKIKSRAQWCEQNGILFVFVVIPNKHSIYPEYYPYLRPRGVTRADQLLNPLRDTDVLYIFPRNFFISQKKDFSLYYKNDTHWNNYGAFLFFGELKKILQTNLPDVQLPNYDFKMEVTKADAGQLPNLLGFSSKKSALYPLIQPKNSLWEDIFTYQGKDTIAILSRKNLLVTTENKRKDLPTAIIFRDSFFNSLHPFTSSIFSKVDYFWKSFDESDKEYILQNKPDVVIWEIVERGLGEATRIRWKN